MQIKELKTMLNNTGYIVNDEIAYAVYSSLMFNHPLLIEGLPGSGKTELAKALSKALDLDLIRVSFYEGITHDRILYDYNYQKQLLTIESLKPLFSKKLEDETLEESIEKMSKMDFYSQDFLIERPVLKSIRNRKKRAVLLLDEIDKSTEEIEYALLEFLAEFSMTIPQLGTITCEEGLEPIVILTSNNYRVLSDALKRRCNYLYIKEKSIDEIREIINSRLKVDKNLLDTCIKIISKIKKIDLKTDISASEIINWVEYTSSLDKYDNDKEILDKTIHVLIKNKEDMEKVKYIF